MKKTIILSENSFKKIKKLIIKEAISSGPIFGRINYAGDLATLATVKNLHTDRYKDYNLEESWNNWKNTGFDKNCTEYYTYLSNFKRFMFGGNDGDNKGFLGNVSYTIYRTNCTFDELLLDSNWVKSVNSKRYYKYSDLNSNNGGDNWQCFYTTILKLYQNPAIWNDFFFNPEFKQYSQKFFKIRDRLSDLFKENPTNYKEKYSPLLPKKEYFELNKFVGVLDKIYDETGREVIGWEIRDKKNQMEDLFYNPPKYDDEEDEYGV
jgi:hypothetical protein